MFKFIKKLLLFVFIIAIITMGFFTYQGYSLYREAINEMSIEDKVKKIHEDTENFTEYSKLPKNYVNAILAVEDRKFFEHNGINVISILRALLMNIKELRAVEGGSTITQQLAKNIYFTQKKTNLVLFQPELGDYMLMH